MKGYEHSMKLTSRLAMSVLLALVVSTAAEARERVFYYHNDHLGTPQVMTDQQGTVVWAAEYEPFGKATVITSTITNNLRFPGQYYDAETGLHYNWHRDYDPETGRYLQADPAGIRNGENHLYAYAKNNPVLYIDPEGLWAEVCVAFALRGIDHVWLDVNGTKRGFYPIKHRPFYPGEIRDDSKMEGHCGDLKVPECGGCTQDKFERCLLWNTPIGPVSDANYNLFIRNCGSYMYGVIKKCRENCGSY